MKTALKAIGGCIAAVVAVGLLGWGVMGNQFFMSRFFAPRFERTRREVFEQSKAYNTGMIQELQNMQFQYEQASVEHKSALRSIILRRAADYDEDRLPGDLRRFISSIKESQ